MGDSLRLLNREVKIIMATDVATLSSNDQIGEINKYDFRTESEAVFKARRGLDSEIVRQISEMKNEPPWMLDFRLKSLEIFQSKPMPSWGGARSISTFRTSITT